MPRRAPTPRRPTRPASPPPSARRPHAPTRLFIAAAVLLVAAVAAAAWLVPEPARRLRERADVASRAGRWEDALALWRDVNRTDAADALSLRAEARAALALGRAAQADAALVEAIRLDPSGPEPWLIRLERFRLLGDPYDAQATGEAAHAAVPPASRPAVLRAWTLALLSDAPDDLARATLSRWIAADPDDLDALAALDRRHGEYPQASDPARAGRIARLERELARRPDHVPLRDALAHALAEDGQPARGRAVLDAWPAAARDARFDRLDGRWALEYEADPDRAVAALRRAVAALPIDRKSRYRLARAEQAAGHADEARRQAAEVARFHEALDPIRLGRRLDEALEALDTPEGRLALADLCASLDLTRLADLWRREAQSARAAR
jgi:tetratricopeptide (TPR) repeat protein